VFYHLQLLIISDFNMDLFNKFASAADSATKQDHQQPPQQQQSAGGGADDLLGKLGSFAGNSNSQDQPPQKEEGGGLLDKLQGLAGGGAEGEKREDALDKGAYSPHPFVPTSSAKCLAWWVTTLPTEPEKLRR
jgi:hypothetical protein